MAKDTGGEFFQNFNNLGEAMGNMLRRTSVTYVLTIQPADLRSDGKYRKLNVKLKNAPKGARVTHRPGYYAPKPFRERGAFERQLQAAEMVVGGGAGSGSVAARVLAAPFQQAGELAYVPVVIEIPGGELLTGHQGDGLPIEIYAYALDSEGNIRGHVAQSLGLDLKKVAATLRTTGIKFFGHLDLAPGDYALRVLIRNSQTGVYGLQVLSLTVPAKTATVPYLLPPLFPEAAGRWIMLRENLKAGQTPPAYPFMVRQDPYIPAVRAEIPDRRRGAGVAGGLRFRRGRPAGRDRGLRGRRQPRRRRQVARDRAASRRSDRYRAAAGRLRSLRAGARRIHAQGVADRLRRPRRRGRRAHHGGRRRGGGFALSVRLGSRRGARRGRTVRPGRPRGAGQH